VRGCTRSLIAKKTPNSATSVKIGHNGSAAAEVKPKMVVERESSKKKKGEFGSTLRHLKSAQNTLKILPNSP